MADTIREALNGHGKWVLICAAFTAVSGVAGYFLRSDHQEVKGNIALLEAQRTHHAEQLASLTTSARFQDSSLSQIRDQLDRVERHLISTINTNTEALRELAKMARDFKDDK